MNANSYDPWDKRLADRVLPVLRAAVAGGLLLLLLYVYACVIVGVGKSNGAEWQDHSDGDSGYDPRLVEP